MQRGAEQARDAVVRQIGRRLEHQRRLVVLWLDVVIGRRDEPALRVHLARQIAPGREWTPEDLREAMLHVALYAGVPAANHAIKIIKNTLDEMNGRREEELT